MAPESEAAWQVLAGDLPVEPTIMQQVQAQLPLLDSTEFHNRALAMRTLRKLGKPGALCLMHVSRSTLSCEQTARIDEVLSRFTAFPDETSSRLRENADFLVDCLAKNLRRALRGRSEDRGPRGAGYSSPARNLAFTA